MLIVNCKSQFICSALTFLLPQLVNGDNDDWELLLTHWQCFDNNRSSSLSPHFKSLFVFIYFLSGRKINYQVQIFCPESLNFSPHNIWYLNRMIINLLGNITLQFLPSASYHARIFVSFRKNNFFLFLVIWFSMFLQSKSILH